MVKVSIIMPVLNGEEFLALAIESILVQTLTDWELLIIDDGSSDGSRKIISSYMEKDNRIKLLPHSENKGLVFSLNEGLNIAAGEFVARLDADDEWIDPKKLAKQLDFLNNNPAVALVGTFAKMVSLQGAPIRDLIYPQTHQIIVKEILTHNCFVHSSIMARKHMLLDAGGYIEAEKHVEDYGLWLRLGLKNQLANLPEFMVRYRLNPLGITQTKRLNQILAAKFLIKKYQSQYPNFLLAWLKWTAQYYRIKIFRD